MPKNGNICSKLVEKVTNTAIGYNAGRTTLRKILLKYAV